jgi:hypothetical protein
MPLLTVFLVIILVAFLLWVVQRFIPMAPGFRTLLNGVAIVALVWWLLKVSGLLHTLGAVHL